jgi:hypothetical protein
MKQPVIYRLFGDLPAVIVSSYHTKMASTIT